MAKVKILFCFFFTLIFSVAAFAQQNKMLAGKAFYFLDVLNSSERIKKTLVQNTLLHKITEAKLQTLENALQNCNNATYYAEALKWSGQEILTIGDEILKAYQSDATFKAIIPVLRKTGKYKCYDKTDTMLIRNAWRLDALGINKVLDTYIEGLKPLYPKIDSISFDTKNPAFKKRIQDSLLVLYKKHASEQLFFKVPLNACFSALAINGRDEAVRYEPLAGGLNAAPYQQIKKTNWSQYQYSAILVPGSGPEEAGIALDSKGANRCEMAAVRYRKGLAPFIFVSGGHVHPNKTPFCEAVEMKKYMVDSLKIPADAIFIEPYARHTTTNLRNVNRMIYQFGFPADKPVITVTDKSQSKYILAMDKRCIAELGYVPYQKMQKRSDVENEYYPEIKSQQINALDVLDP